ncbi:hypothetical protein IDH44_15490 [Paenibacillus sp. IB182496]|uniref:Uncharacterized protein n=1 Tax=Paenibacillus sabuli TaxID=2772509 RepID=A0A927GSI6_9BACL|nr:hypothetical protein [Paenibacillus sabuli]MBD2846603.1 hypothetical protein [Paenibacillus sabuli]
MTYDLIIVGATTTALGVAQAVQGRLKTLIVNATEMVAYEFVNTYKQPELYTQGAAYNAQFRELEADVLLGTEVVSVAKSADGGYTLELLGPGGYRTVTGARLVDTTLEREAAAEGKSLNALLIQQQGEPLPALQWPGMELVPETHDHAYTTAILKFDCAPQWDVAEARHRLVEAWLERPEALQSWRMAAIAFCFDERTQAGQWAEGTRYAVLPAAAYARPEESIAAGGELGRSWVS